MSRKATKQSVIAALCIGGNTRRFIFDSLVHMVNEQTEPLIFKQNVDGHREALPVAVQRQRLWDAIGRIMAAKGQTFDESEKLDDDDVKEEAPKAPKTENAESYFIRRVKEIRRFCIERSATAGGQLFDHISVRPQLDGIRAIRQGISADAMLYAMTMHWSPDARRDANIAAVKFEDECKPIGDGFHRLAGYAVKLAKARVPIMFVGDFGTGKSHLAEQLAGLLGVTYAECPMTAGATPSWLLGRQTLKDFITSAAMDQYQNGGVFNFEEIDASDANMLLVMNQALAAKRFFNPANSQLYPRSPFFVPVATANTFGMGANRTYTGRERQDAAQLDRWRMGRVPVVLDEALADYISLSQEAPLEFPDAVI